MVVTISAASRSKQEPGSCGFASSNNNTSSLNIHLVTKAYILCHDVQVSNGSKVDNGRTTRGFDGFLQLRLVKDVFSSGDIISSDLQQLLEVCDAEYFNDVPQHPVTRAKQQVSCRGSQQNQSLQQFDGAWLGVYVVSEGQGQSTGELTRLDFILNKNLVRRFFLGKRIPRPKMAVSISPECQI